MTKAGVRRIQSNGQVSIPSDFVKMLDLNAGDLVLFEKQRCGIVIKKAEIKEVAHA